MKILAIDIGKTKTFAIVTDEKGNVQTKSVSGPSGAWLEENVIIKNVREAIESCLSKTGLNLSELDLISISWSDLDTKQDWVNAWKIVEKIGLIREKVIIEHDAVAAYYAVTWGEPGIAVIAGTGSIAYGINKRGERMRASGWGWLIGDEGSAYWIAVKALNAISRAYDGRGEKTLLTEKVKKRLSIREELEIMIKIYKEMQCDITEISKIAEIVDEAATEGDKVALDILKEAGKELASCVTSIAKRLEMENDKIIVGGVGSVFKCKTVNNTFNEILKVKLPNAKIREPLVGQTAIIGPIVIALKKYNLPITATLTKKIIEKVL